MLYTGKGDGGTSKVIGDRERRGKAEPIFEALGTLDELNSFLGWCRERARKEGIGVAVEGRTVASILRGIQENLFIAQAELAGAEMKIGAEKTKEAEGIINEIEKQLPPIKGFVVAGGTELAAMLEVARTVARRAERRVIAAEEAGRKINEGMKYYLNRLSSLLYALARLVNQQAGLKEEGPKYG